MRSEASRGRGTRRYHHGGLRPVLLATGRRMLERDGLRGFSLWALAREARVSNAAPVHHFPTADDLFSDCAEDGFDELGTRLEDARADEPAETLAAMAGVYLRFAEENPVVFRLMFDRGALRRPGGEFKASASRAYNLLSDAIRAIEPEASPDAFDTRINTIWGVIHGVTMLRLDGQICRSSSASPGATEMLQSVVRRLATGGDPA